jgi:hypothetical protein
MRSPRELSSGAEALIHMQGASNCQLPDGAYVGATRTLDLDASHMA